ncbi:hypothetical protein EVA_16979 [gut metagenome]|uniref:Uncharacterized protein n=1 Tax=gut metagenome TaxID=749906 RepID=J9G5Y0_9ZZZZ
MLSFISKRISFSVKSFSSILQKDPNGFPDNSSYYTILMSVKKGNSVYI